MPRISDKPLIRVAHRVWKDDYANLKRFADSTGNISINMLVRQILHEYVVRLQDLERQKLDQRRSTG